MPLRSRKRRKRQSRSRVYVSVTGLRVRRLLYQPLFWRHAVPSMVDAKGASGNVMAAARKVDGVHHTLSAWKTKADMLAYLRSPRHARAMRRFPGFATGRVYGFEADAVPDWDTALASYHERGRDVYRGR